MAISENLMSGVGSVESRFSIPIGVGVSEFITQTGIGGYAHADDKNDAGLPLHAHPHMLRHACGYALADQGADTRLIQDYLGHRNIQHTVRYTASNPARFQRLWQ